MSKLNKFYASDREQVLNNKYQNKILPKNARTMTFENLENKEGFELAVKTFKFMQHNDFKSGVYMQGRPSVGKTSYLIAMYNHILNNLHIIQNRYCADFSEIIITNSEEFYLDLDEKNPNINRDNLLMDCMRSRFLFFDSIGSDKETISNTERFKSLVNYRELHRLPIFCTTNLTENYLNERYTESCMNKLKLLAHPVKVTGEPFINKLIKQTDEKIQSFSYEAILNTL